MNKTLELILGLTLVNALCANAPEVDTKPYFDLRARLSTEHCAPDIFRGIYSEKGQKKSERLVVDFACPSNLSLTLNDSTQIMFVTNGGEAWVLHKTKNGEVTADTVVEHYPDANTHWPSLWLTMFQKLQANERSPTEIESAKEFLEAYSLSSEIKADQTKFSLNSKANHLPNIEFSYKENEELPSRINFAYLKETKRSFVRNSLDKIKSLGPRHFIPDTRTSNKIYKH